MSTIAATITSVVEEEKELDRPQHLTLQTLITLATRKLGMRIRQVIKVVEELQRDGYISSDSTTEVDGEDLLRNLVLSQY